MLLRPVGVLYNVNWWECWHYVVGSLCISNHYFPLLYICKWLLRSEWFSALSGLTPPFYNKFIYFSKYIFILLYVRIYFVFIKIISYINIHRLEKNWVLGSDSQNQVSHPHKCVAGFWKVMQTVLGWDHSSYCRISSIPGPFLLSASHSLQSSSQLETLSYISIVSCGVVMLVEKLLWMICEFLLSPRF